jgi:hypothetical protein
MMKRSLLLLITVLMISGELHADTVLYQDSRLSVTLLMIFLSWHMPKLIANLLGCFGLLTAPENRIAVLSSDPFFQVQ